MMIEDEELRNLYQISGEESLQKLEAGLLHLLKHPEDEATLEQLLWETHRLKGDSRSVGRENVVILTQQVEEILLSIKRQETIFTPEVLAVLQQGLDAISLLVYEAVSGQVSGVDPEEILEQLRRTFFESALLEEEIEPIHPALVVVEIINDPTQPPSTLIEDEELREIYKDTSEERLQKIAAGLLHLSKHPEDEVNLEKLLREVHTLKGDSRIAETENVVILTQQIEDIFLSIKRKENVFTPELGAFLQQGLDAISLLVYEAVSGEASGVDVEEILEQLKGAVLESELPQQQVELVPETELNLIEDEELREIYKDASEERLQKMEAGLHHLRSYPEDEAILEELLREAHSLKGDSRSVGIENVVTLTHQFEEILLRIKHRDIFFTPQLSDRLYQGLDAISLLVQEAVTGQPSGIDTGVILNILTEPVSFPKIQEFQPVSPEFSSLSTIPVQPTTDADDLPSSTPEEIAQPYHIDSIRVQTQHLDALMAQAEELTMTKIAIAHVAAEIEQMASLWEEWKATSNRGKNFGSSSSDTNPYTERLEKIINSLRTSTQENSTKLDIITGELREKIRTLRLLPLSTVFKFLRRTVRDLAREQSKQVELIIEGEEITADKRILEEIKDSLLHMVRNAIDHGLETPGEREQLGKSPVGTIKVKGYQTGNNIVIEITDDGRGLDIEKIQKTAINRGLYQPEELALMTSSQILSLILAPGFSTRTFITEISGRGIGLDVVRTNVERLQGNIQIESTPGQGCTFRIQLSTTLATTNALLVEVQGIVHALPVEFVQRTLIISPEEIFTTFGQASINLDGQVIPVANLADLLELSNSPAYVHAAKEQQTSNLQACILLKVGEELAGFLVDRLLDAQEIAIKSQSQLLKRVRNVMGATILGSGEVCMILNPSDLLKSLHLQTTSSVVPIKPKPKNQRKRVILLVEDSPPVRIQEKRLLERAGYEVAIAVDGLDGYNQLKTRNFDAVVSDVEMPHLDGFSLTARIRQHPEYQALPIILVTTLASDEDKKRGAEVGANAYIIKGNFNQDILLEILEKII